MSKQLKIKTAEEQIAHAAKKRSDAKIRRQTIKNRLAKLLPKFIEDNNDSIMSVDKFKSQLKQLEITCEINSVLAASVGSKLLRDSISKTLKNSGLKKRHKAEIELIALIYMAILIEELIISAK